MAANFPEGMETSYGTGRKIGRMANLSASPGCWMGAWTAYSGVRSLAVTTREVVRDGQLVPSDTGNLVTSLVSGHEGNKCFVPACEEHGERTSV